VFVAKSPHRLCDVGQMPETVLGKRVFQRRFSAFIALAACGSRDFLQLSHFPLAAINSPSHHLIKKFYLMLRRFLCIIVPKVAA
jgi:hypothetical protein